MPQQGSRRDRYDRREPVEPYNPPRAVVRPRSRTLALRVYLGGLLLLFLIIGLTLIYRGTREPDAAAEAPVGTTGELPEHEETPGGFDPGPRHRTTEDEMRFRGMEPSQD